MVGRVSLAKLLIAAGLFMMITALGLGLGGAWWEELDRRRLEESMEARSTTRASRGVSVEDLGILRVDRLGWSVIVRPSTSEFDLARGAGWIPGTALPGEAGNSAIAGHRDTFFRAMRRFKVGDEVVLVTREQTVRYEVSDMSIVNPDQVDVISPTSRAALTLVTCYPFNLVGRAPKRYIVRAFKKKA
jgi:sortase A